MNIHPMAETIAIIMLGITLCGLVGRGVWIISRLYTKVNDIVIPKITETHERVMSHSESCDPHRQDLEFRVNAIEKLAEG